MKHPLLYLCALLPLAAAGCPQNGFVLVTVVEPDGGRGQPQVFQIRSLATDIDGGRPAPAYGPKETDAIAFPKTFVVEVPSSATTVSETVEGLDFDGNTVLRGWGTTNFKAGSQNIPLQVALTPACSTTLDCNALAVCQGLTLCSAHGACVANGVTTPPAFATPCGNDGGRCDFAQQCTTPFGFCGDGVLGSDPLPDGGVSREQCDWGAAGTGSCTGPDGGCNSLQPNACRPDCTLPICGDGIVDTGEKCDLGTLNGTAQGCNATCTLIGTVTRIAGNGDVYPDGGRCVASCYQDGPGAQAMFEQVSGLAIVGNSLLVADTLGEVVRAVDLGSAPAYNVTTLAGNPATQGAQNGTGSDAGFFLPLAPLAYQGAALIGTGMNIEQLTVPGGVVTDFAGPASGTDASENGADDVPFAAARFSKVTALALDPATGDIYSIDQGSGRIRQLVPTDGDGGVVNDFAGGGGGLPGTFKDPTGAVVLSAGLFVSDSQNYFIDLVTLDGVTQVSTVAGNGGAGFSDSSAPGGATFSVTGGLCTDGTTLYIVDQDNQAIRQMDPTTFQVTTVAGSPDGGVFDRPYACAWDPAARVLYVSDQSRQAATADGIGNVIRMIQ